MISLKQLILSVQDQRAEFEFTTTYRDTHYLWIVNDVKILKEIEETFKTIDTIYIADGHHRSASSSLLSKEMRSENSNNNNYHYFMSYLIPESDLRIYEFNRLVNGLNGLSKEAFLIKLDTMYRIENRGTTLYQPSKKHHFSMYLDGEFYSLYLRKKQLQNT